MINNIFWQETKNNNFKLIKWLLLNFKFLIKLRYGDNNNNSILHEALLKNHLELVKLISYINQYLILDENKLKQTTLELAASRSNILKFFIKIA